MSKPKPRRSSRPVSSGTVSPNPGETPAPANSSPGPKPAAKVARLQRPARRREWTALALPGAVLLVVLGIVLVVYWPALSASALYIDELYYLASPVLQHPSWASVQTIFSEVFAPTVVIGYYHPLTLVSVMLDFLDPAALQGLMPFHRTTLILHLLNVALVVVLLYLLFDNWLTAGFLGLLYGLHPLNADAVLWVAERKTVLSTFFSFSALVFYVLYAQQAVKKRRGDWKLYGAALLLYVCALLSKPTAVPVAVLLLVLDFWPLNRLNRRTLLEKAPFLIAAGLSAVVTVISQKQTGEIAMPDAGNPLFLPLVIVYSIGFYLFKTVWPTGLAADYPFPEPFTLANPVVLFSVVGAVVVIAALVLSLRRTRAWLAGGLFFFIAIFPALGVIRFTSTVVSNRFMYLPMLGLLLPLNWALNRLWNTAVGVLSVSRVRMMMAGVGVILAVAAISVTWVYESHWQDSLTLLHYYLTQTPDQWKLHNRLGNELVDHGDYDAGIAELKEAARLAPGWTENQLNLGRAMYTAKRYAEAREAVAVALQQTPNDWLAHVLMGMTQAQLQDLEGALKEFRTAAQLAPMEAEPHFNIADTLTRQGKTAEAIQEYQRTLQLNPQYWEAQSALDTIASKQP